MLLPPHVLFPFLNGLRHTRCRCSMAQPATVETRRAHRSLAFTTWHPRRPPTPPSLSRLPPHRDPSSRKVLS